MYIDYSVWESYEYSLNTLNLDLDNPRLKYRGVTLNQTQIIKFLIDKEKVYELAKKISEEGFFVGEAPIICIENDKKIVLEGNRRTAALKILQDPKKYLPSIKANILIKNILKNNFPVDKKLSCNIAPNRLLANPIIYSRHNGTSLEKWKTGNQYAFVAEMYYDDGLSIEDICDVLNERRTRIIKPLKAYNLFMEGQTILANTAGISLTIDEFDFTNLERFYTYDDARQLIGIDFNENDGELIIKLPRQEFEKRILTVFKRLIDSERFSRDFNKDEDKKKYIKELKYNSNFDLDTKEEIQGSQSRSSEHKSDLEEQKKRTTSRRKQNLVKTSYLNNIIPRDVLIDFDNAKLNSLFLELQGLPFDKKYSFAVLLRTYLEQVLFFYVQKRSLNESISQKSTEERKKNGLQKVNTLIEAISKKYGIQDKMSPDIFMNILRFDQDKMYSLSLKIMLDFVKNHELSKFNLEPSLARNIAQYLENVKMELDLAVHNINFVIDTSHNIRAWNHLYPLFLALNNELRDLTE